MKDPMITDIQRFSTHDGPGIRTTVFFKGCPLRCLWCHNPETNSASIQPQLNFTRCTYCGACAGICGRGCHRIEITDDGRPRHIFDVSSCAGCLKCTGVCAVDALEAVGKLKTVEEIMKIVESDRAFYGKGKNGRTLGGITLSGGEPTMQAEAANALLSAARERGISTCIETCGYFLDRIELELCDTICFDIKTLDRDRHIELTGTDNDRIMANLALAAENAAERIILRYVVVAGLTDSISHAGEMRALADRYGIAAVEPLAFHPYGSSKADAIGRGGKAIGKEGVPDEDTMAVHRRISRI